MADYYPLISRAVAGLEKNSGEARRAVYERARGALLAQLRGVTPALNESDITRERLALEEAIRKVEAESARQFVDPSRSPPAPRIRPAEPPPEASRAQPRDDAFRAAASPRSSSSPRPRAPEPDRWDEAPRAPAASQQPRQPQQPQARQDTASALRRPAPPPPAAPAMPGPRYSESMFDQPIPPESAPPAPRHPLRGQDRRSLSASGLKDFRDVVSEANELGGASARATRSARDAYAAVPAPAPELEQPEPQFDRGDPRMFEQHEAHEPRPHEDFPEPMLEPSFTVEESRPTPPKARRAAPAPIEDEEEFEREEVRPRRSYPGLIRAIAAFVILIGLVGLAVWQWPNMVALYRVLRAPSTEVAREQPTTATRPKIPDRLEPGTPPQEQPGAAVAQKVVLYEEDPADPQGKRFVGSALWRTETVSAGPGQPPELAVRADVEVPERKLAMTWSFRRNTDKTLPASHTVEIMFKLPADFPSGGISNVPGILMKQAEQTRGVPLAGLAVKVTTGFFLIGLSAADAERERNLQLLKERGWFDIPVVYNNNRRAILAMEKGTPGERVFAEAFRVWKQ